MIGSPGVGMLEFNAGLAESYLSDGSTVIFITADLPAGEVLETMRRFGVDTEKALGEKLFLIDYHSSLLGSYKKEEPPRPDHVRKVMDIEGIMYNIDSIATHAELPVKIFLHSLSTLFLHNQPSVVLKFYQISSSRIRSEFGSAIFTVYDGVHDEKSVNHLIAMADGVIEMKFDDELRRMMRIRHMRNSPTSTQWVPFNIKKLGSTEERPLLEWR